MILGVLALTIKERERAIRDDVAAGTLPAIDPTVVEILLCGDIAWGDQNPGRIDMLIVDRGHYSRCEVMLFDLQFALEGLFGVDEQMAAFLAGVPVNLYLAPSSILTSDRSRRHISAESVGNPAFLSEAFTRLLRFNEDLRAFVPVTVEWLEARYCNEPAFEPL